MQKHIVYHADACMKGRVMQSGENPAMLVVCVCEAIYPHTLPSRAKHRVSSFTWHDAHAL